jgi:hypothetical protein
VFQHFHQFVILPIVHGELKRLQVSGLSACSSFHSLLSCFFLDFVDYLGTDRKSWEKYDATILLRTMGKSKYENILIDVGTADSFLKNGQLLPEVRHDFSSPFL